MSIQFSIANATPKSGPSLCRTCKHAKRIDGQNGEEIVRCGAFSEYINFRVAKCTAYHPANMPWLAEMMDIAWTVEARKRGPVGFTEGTPLLDITIEPPTHKSDFPPTPFEE